MSTSTARLSVNGPRLLADLKALGSIGRGPGGGLDRTSFSAADGEARAWLLGRCAEAGLSAEVDGIGNIVVSPDYDARTAAQPAVWSGSHIDTVPNGGAFDGALGVLAALECLRRIQEERPALDRPVRAVIYTDEEGNYAHLFGSSALVRGFARTELESLTGRDGDRFADTFAATGGDLDAATATKLDPATLHATVELHIGQGPTLEHLGHDIGVVTGIVALGGGVVSFRGRADHAGTTPMDRRRNTLTRPSCAPRARHGCLSITANRVASPSAPSGSPAWTTCASATLSWCAASTGSREARRWRFRLSMSCTTGA